MKKTEIKFNVVNMENGRVMNGSPVALWAAERMAQEFMRMFEMVTVIREVEAA